MPFHANYTEKERTMGSIPTHCAECTTLVYPVKCRGCDRGIYILECSPCGSMVRFNRLGWPWPKHNCRRRYADEYSMSIENMRARGERMSLLVRKVNGRKKVVCVRDRHGEYSFNMPISKLNDAMSEFGLPWGVGPEPELLGGRFSAQNAVLCLVWDEDWGHFYMALTNQLI